MIELLNFYYLMGNFTTFLPIFTMAICPFRSDVGIVVVPAEALAKPACAPAASTMKMGVPSLAPVTKIMFPWLCIRMALSKEASSTFSGVDSFSSQQRMAVAVSDFL